MVATAGKGGRSVGDGVGIGGRGSNGADNGGGSHRSIVVNATIFLPVSEGTFVDADYPLLVRY